jgi:MFS transporter, AAHS family, 4-hydroxybenzoate transporter
LLQSDFDVGAAIGEARLGLFQIAIVLICGVIMLLDGVDTQAIAFAAPVIAHDWGLNLATLGPIFSVGLVGGVLSGTAIGAIGNRFGYKPVLVIALLTFSLGSIATGLCHSVAAMMALRLITGLGLGAAVPLLLAITSEYAPRSVRALCTALIGCGYPLGGVIGGLLAIRLLPAFGWSSIFFVGGVLPLLTLPLFLLFVPESCTFLILNGKHRAAVDRILRRLHIIIRPEQTPIVHVGHATKAGPRDLFADGRLGGTLFLWLTSWLGTLVCYVLVSWTPTLLKQEGLSLEVASLSAILLNLGGVTANAISGYVMDRSGRFGVIAVLFLLASVFILLIGWPRGMSTAMLGVIFLAGAFAIGGQMSLVTLATIFYPVPLRAAAVGWTMAISRVGAVIGPSAVSLLLLAGFPPSAVFAGAAVVALLSSASVMMMRHMAHRHSPPSLASDSA